MLTQKNNENICMRFSTLTNLTNHPAKKALVLLMIIFSVSCLKLCADDTTPAQAQVARETFVAEAKKYVGCPYVLGAVGPDNFDCSGLIYFVARESIGKQLPRTSRALYSYCKIVPDSKKEVGDLLFFKTNNTAPITHVGIYIGNNQFISAISDGPNTGVIISSLNQPYWKPKYVACGQFIKSGKSKYAEEEFEEEVVKAETKSSKQSKKTTVAYKGSSFYKADAQGFDAFTVDSSAFCNWSLISPNEFVFKWRGIDLHTNVRYSKWVLEPGFGLCFRYNHGLGVFQLPLTFTATVNDFLRFYAGPVFTFGSPQMIGTGEAISASIFPGIIGISFSTPSFPIAKSRVQLVQDISYTVFNQPDNAALPFLQSISAGLVMFTGFRVTFSAGSFFKK